MATATASDKRLLLAKLADARDLSNGGPRRRAIQRTAAVLVVMAALVLLMLWLSGFFSTPKEVLEIRAMVDEQIGQLQKVARNEAPFTYDTPNFRQNWDRMREMPQEVRDQVRSEMERLSHAREKAERQSYFAIPPQDRQKELDRRIKAEETRRQAWRQQRGNPNGGNGARSQDGTGGQAGTTRGGQGRVNAGAGGTQANTAGPRGDGPGGSGSGGSRGGTEDARNARSKQRIDTTSPEERAQRTEYRRAMDARRAQLGLSPGRGRGG